MPWAPTGCSHVPPLLTRKVAPVTDSSPTPSSPDGPDLVEAPSRRRWPLVLGALVLLQSAGLVELKSGGSIFSDLADIDTEASRVQVEALDAALTATSLDDLAGAVVNNDFVERAGLDFDDALAQDDPDDTKALPYANVFAAQADDLDDPTYQRLVEIYQETQAVQEGVVEVSGGTAVMLDTPVEDLRAILAEVESDTRDQQG